jgi:hypothetical protein
MFVSLTGLVWTVFYDGDFCMSANAATGLMRGKAIWHFVSLQYQQQSGGNSTTLILSFFF